MAPPLTPPLPQTATAPVMNSGSDVLDAANLLAPSHLLDRRSSVGTASGFHAASHEEREYSRAADGAASPQARRAVGGASWNPPNLISILMAPQPRPLSSSNPQSFGHPPTTVSTTSGFRITPSFFTICDHEQHSLYAQPTPSSTEYQLAPTSLRHQQSIVTSLKHITSLDDSTSASHFCISIKLPDRPT